MAAEQGFSINGPDDPLEVLCELDPENLEVGRAFSLALVVKHGELREVTIVPPDFRDKFRLEGQRTSVRLSRDASRNLERWSVFEFTLVPLEAGAQRLSPFGVRAREQTLWTASIPLTIAPARAMPEPPIFRWETPFPALKVGKWSVFRLLVTNASNLSKNALRRLRFAPPPEAIVESAVLDPETGRNVIELRVLPMRTGTFTLKAIDVDAEARDGTILRLRIPELRAPIGAP
ncbi:MAG: hypothetical protein LBT00_04805 [Spirochaetaceae bacterium]|jgi:hypothetical protein|nr:hypothetical protein [Spirochaetaceae bacterium]